MRKLHPLKVPVLLASLIFCSMVNKTIAQNTEESPVVFTSIKDQPGRLTEITALAKKYSFFKPDSALSLISQGLTVAHSLKNQKAIIALDNLKGEILKMRGDYTEAFFLLDKNLKKARLLEDSILIAGTLVGLGNVHQVKQELDKAISSFRQALSYCLHYEDSEPFREAHIGLGGVNFYKGQFEKSIHYWEKSLQLSQQAHDQKNISNCYNNLGISYRAKGDYDTAKIFLKQALQVGQEINDKQCQMLSLHSLSAVNLDQGDYKKALNQSLQAEKLSWDLGAKEMNARIKLNIASNYTKSGKLEKALSQYQEAIMMLKQLESVKGIFIAYANMGSIYLYKKSYTDALESFINAKKQALKLTDTTSILNANIRLCKTYMKLGQLKQADDIYRETIKLQKTKNIPSQRLELLHLAAQIKTQQKELGLALTLLDESEKIALDHQITPKLVSIYSDKSKLYEQTGNYKNAYRYQKKYDLLQDSLLNARNDETILELEAKYETEQKKREIASLKKEQQLRQEIITKQEKVNTQKSQIIISLLILGFVLLAAGIWIYNANRKLTWSRNELQLVNSELAKSNKTKEQLITLLAHDLKSPIDTWRTILSINSKDAKILTKEDILQALNFMNHDFRSLQDFINNLLYWITGQQHQIDYQPTLIKPKELIKEVMDLYQPGALLKNISLSYSEELPGSYELFTDKQLLMVILRNLISNAIKFTPENGEVKVCADLQENKFRLNIIDTGPGISTQKINSLFDLQDDSQKSTEKDIHLGLKISARFVKMLKGRIKAESKEGEGSQFEVFLPA